MTPQDLAEGRRLLKAREDAETDWEYWPARDKLDDWQLNRVGALLDAAEERDALRLALETCKVAAQMEAEVINSLRLEVERLKSQALNYANEISTQCCCGVCASCTLS